MLAIKTLLLIQCLLFVNILFAIVKYDEGNFTIDGVQFLQDRELPNNYYYIPQYPRVAYKANGDLEILCMKYVGTGGAGTNGGIFHALIEFSLPDKLIETLTEKLKKVAGSSAKIVGPVPIQQVSKDGEAGLASFSIISSVLKDNSFTKSIITSGFAPFLPGSKAAVSARLTQEGATLLFATLERPTSDVSVALSGYYEAAVKSYNAIITAESKLVYEHFSKIINAQEGFTKDEIRRVTDQLIRDQTIKVEVFDRSSSLGQSAKDMEAIVNIVTDKLVDLMFNAERGWSKDPERVAAVAQNQIPMRQSPGFFGQLFSGSGNQPYVSDNQFTLKRIKDERLNKFYLNLSKSTTVRVPVYTTGNVSFLMNNLSPEEKSKYFPLVNMDDASFQQRNLAIQIDGSFAEAFSEVFNFVTISMRKIHGSGQHDTNREIVFDRKTVDAGNVLQNIQYPRLNVMTSDWLNYEYKVSWSLVGNKKQINEPVTANQWIKTNATALSLTPPITKRVIEMDADRSFFQEKGVVSATVQFTSSIQGETIRKTVILRAGDTDITKKIAIYGDAKAKPTYQITWFTKDGQTKEAVKPLTEDYMIIIPMF